MAAAYKDENKTEKETGKGAPPPADARGDLMSVFDCAPVTAAVERAETRLAAGHTTSGRPKARFVASDEVTEENLSGWTQRTWASAFTEAMERQNARLAYSRGRGFRTQVYSIVEHLVAHGFKLLQVHQFLIEWFPQNYDAIRQTVFTQDPGWVLAVPWLEPRLPALVEMFRNTQPARGASRVKRKVFSLRRVEDAAGQSPG